MFFVYDISNFISWFLSQMLSISGNALSILDSFQFNGISILDFCLCIGILTVILTTILPRLRSGADTATKVSRYIGDN